MFSLNEMICCIFCTFLWNVMCLYVYWLFTWYINVFKTLIMTMQSGWICVQRLIGDSRSLPVFFTMFVCTSNSVDHGWWVIIFCWRFQNDEAYKHIFNIWYISELIFLFIPLLLKSLYIYPLKIYDLFWDVKIKNWLFRKIENQKHQTGMHFTPQLQFF